METTCDHCGKPGCHCDELVPDYLCPLCLCDSDGCLCDPDDLEPSCSLCLCDLDECLCGLEDLEPPPVTSAFVNPAFFRAFAYGHWATMHKRRFSFSRHMRQHGAKQLLLLRKEQRKLFACEGWIATLPEVSGLLFWADFWDTESRRQQIATWDCPF